MAIDARPRHFHREGRKRQAATTLVPPSIDDRSNGSRDALDRFGSVPEPVSVGSGAVEVRRVRVASAVRVASGFAITSLVVWVGAVTLVLIAATAGGLTADIESLVRSLGVEGFSIEVGPVLLAIATLGIAWIVAVETVAILAALIYNAFAHVWGGLVVELDLPRSTRDL